MTAAPQTLAALVLATALAGCGGRFDGIGEPPPFTQINGPSLEAPPTTNQRFGNPGTRVYGVANDPRVVSPYIAAPSQTAPPDQSYGNAAPYPASLPGRTERTGAGGSLWSSGPGSLFGDRRARGIGDIVTVMIEIDDEAEISNQTDRTRSGSESLEAAALLGLEGVLARILPGETGLSPGVSTSSSSQSAGQGQVRRNESISLKLAARVMDVLPNGQFVVSGRQEVRVNHELRDLQVVGIIRPEDISRRNEITYDRMAEARISYGGRGVVSAVQNPRYGQEAFDRVAPF